MKRFYRAVFHRKGLHRFRIRHKETDLLVQSSLFLEKEAEGLTIEARLFIEEYIRRHPVFIDSLVPLPEDPFAPPLIQEMLKAAEMAGVGPMAGVAGAIAEYVGKGLKTLGAREVIVENGGDIYIAIESECIAGIWAGQSPFSGRIGLRLRPEARISGICTSSGSIGHSLSLGSADAVTVLARSATLADAVATAIGNLVHGGAELKHALGRLKKMPGIQGGVIVVGEKLGAWGEVELVPLSGSMQAALTAR